MSDDFGILKVGLGDKEVDLHCTANAVFKLSRAHGGITPLFQKIQNMDIEAFVSVIRAGANMTDKEASTLAADIASTGMMNLMTPLIEYVTLLCAGGNSANTGGDKEPTGKL